MLDIRLFRNMRFTAASGSVTIAFFTLFGFIFLITQYFQFIHGYSALSTGVHLLPVALSVGVGSVLGTRLRCVSARRLIVTIGLLAMAGFYFWVAATTTTSVSYGIIAAQMVLYGLGMGSPPRRPPSRSWAPSPADQAGVGSAVNDTTRLLGGTLGVAVIGSVYASLYGTRLSAQLPAALPGRLAAVAHQSVGAALSVAGQLGAAGQRAAGGLVRDAATNAFLHGLTVGCLVAGGVAAGGAILAAVFLPAAADPCQPDRPAGRPLTGRS